jgi:hypothetical protein
MPLGEANGGVRVDATKQKTKHGSSDQDQQERLLELGKPKLHPRFVLITSIPYAQDDRESNSD